MLNELLQHIKCKRLEAERANACGPAGSSTESNSTLRKHEPFRRAPNVDRRKAASLSAILKQLNATVETGTPYNLVVKLSDDLFDNFTLCSVGCEKLGRITHFLLSHPGVRLRAEVHTSCTVSEEDDERVSSERVFELVKYFVMHGVPDVYVSARGLVREGYQGHAKAGGAPTWRVALVVAGKATKTKLRGAAAAA